MCARRFLLVIFWLTLISVAAAFAIYQFGQQVLIKGATPQGHFQAPAAGIGPDYAKLENWLARPELSNNPSEWLPEGVAAVPDAPAAIFYVHPTTYLERDRWNATLGGNAQSNYRTRLFVQSQSSALDQRTGGFGPTLPSGGVRRVPSEERGRPEGSRSGLFRHRRGIRRIAEAEPR